MIKTQTGLDRAVKAGKRADIGKSTCWLNARESSTVYAWEGSTVDAWAGSTVYAWAGSTVYAWAGSTVYARESSTVYARAGSTVDAWAGSTVYARESSTVYARAGSTVDDKGGEILPWEAGETRRAEQTAFNQSVAEWIVANPASFDMRQWECGTQMCWAGAAVHLAGKRGAELKSRKGYAGAAGYLCGPEMVKHFYRTSETDAMRSFAEAIASGKSVSEAATENEHGK